MECLMSESPIYGLVLDSAHSRWSKNLVPIDQFEFNIINWLGRSGQIINSTIRRKVV